MRTSFRGTEIEFSRRELGGGLGDIGLFAPIAIALITINGLNATAVFASAGAAYLCTALYFRVPLPVQPLKAFAAAAIALKLSAEVIAAGALLMAAIMALLSATGLAGRLTKVFPLVLVRGIQASVALLLAKAAIDMAAKGNWDGLPPIDARVSFAIAVAGFALLMLFSENRRFPGALLVLGAGAAIGLAVDGGLPAIELGPEALALGLPQGADFAAALTALVIVQLPLSFGNSIVATADAERNYFGATAERVTPDRLAGSMGVWNTLSGAIGGLPICHGAGGATAHYKLGARTPGATIMVGTGLLVLAVAFGSSLPALLHIFPPGAMAAMLIFVAFQHAQLAATLDGVADRAIAASVGAVTLFYGNLAIGFAFGLLLLSARWVLRLMVEHRSAEPVTPAS
ncbi:MAG: hypothetical protein JHD02_00785 [Thermoleophilaceae bacterium]|nr:hypothetical protein [Thermoleophilaceae bacterium]